MISVDYIINALEYFKVGLPFFYTPCIVGKDYCSMVWDNCGKVLKENLQKLHNRAARVITGDTYEIRSFDILKKLNWKTLEERRIERSINLHMCPKL